MYTSPKVDFNLVCFFYWKEHEGCLTQLQLNEKCTEGFRVENIAPAGCFWTVKIGSGLISGTKQNYFFSKWESLKRKIKLIFYKKNDNFNSQTCRFELNLLKLRNFFKISNLSKIVNQVESTDLAEFSSERNNNSRNKRLKFEWSLLSSVCAFCSWNGSAQNALASFSRYFCLFLSLAQFVSQFFRLVWRFFNSVNSDYPVLGCVRFFHVLQLFGKLLFSKWRK